MHFLFTHRRRIIEFGSRSRAGRSEVSGSVSVTGFIRNSVSGRGPFARAHCSLSVSEYARAVCARSTATPPGYVRSSVSNNLG